jgi:hypothetical protein
VTKATRRGFWVNLGTAGGIERGLSAEVVRLDSESALGPDDIRKALADQNFFESQVAGRASLVTRARVVASHPDSAMLRNADPQGGRRVKKGDLVKILGTRMRLCVGGISGTLPRNTTSALRHLLLEELTDRGKIAAVSGPTEPVGIAWSDDHAAALCTAGSNEGCDYATAGAAHLSGDTLHVALGLVDVFSCETVRFITTSVKADPALTALASQYTPGDADAQRPAGAGAGLGTYDLYQTGLRPALAAELKGAAFAVFVDSSTRSLYVADRSSLKIYALDTAGRSLIAGFGYDIERSSPPLPCRDPAGRMAMADSDGDGRDELVLWSNAYESPIAFSKKVSEGGERPILEPADTYWLPWSEPYGDMRYVRGANFMTAAGSGIEFYDSRHVDLDGDGQEESIYTETSGVLRVDDVARHLSLKLADAGAPLEVYDMDLDDLPEIIVSARTRPGDDDTLTFYNYTEEGARQSWRVSDLPGGVVSIAAGLLDGDDLPDLAILLRQNVRDETTTLIVMLTVRP